MQVKLSNHFEQAYATFELATKQIIAKFISDVTTNGLKGLKGRNKSSAPQNPRTKKQRETAKYANKHCLWHYHIGIPEYIGEHGDMTSEYILHYQRFDDEIVIISLAKHPPFTLPSEHKLAN